MPSDVEYSTHGIVTAELLEMAVSNGGYPQAITCAIAYREELRSIGRLEWVYLDLLGAGGELTFLCKAYERADLQQEDGNRNGE